MFEEGWRGRGAKLKNAKSACACSDVPNLAKIA